MRTNGSFRYGFVQFKRAADVHAVLIKARHRIGRCVITVKAANPWNQPDYKEILANPLLVPPAQDAASNILNALNDQCFYEIFKRLNLPDLVNVAEVCVHFNEQAKKTFVTSKYKRLVFTGSEFDDKPNMMRKVMRHFGANIQSLCIESKPRADDYLLQALLDFCTTDELKELRLELFHIQEESPNLGPLFARLEKLEMVHCTMRIKLNQSMADCLLMRSLRFESCNMDDDDECIGRAFVDLDEAHFSHTNFNAEIVGHFIVSNPTITKLSIVQTVDEMRALQVIGQHLPNLRELEIVESNYKSNFEEDVLAIAPLTSLNVLKLHFNWVKAAPLLSALVTNKVALEHLAMDNVWLDNSAAESICQMTQMKVLHVNNGRDLTKEHLLDMVKALPELHELRLLNAVAIDVTALKNIVNNAGKLKSMKLRSCGDFTIDIDDYNQMLYTVQSRPNKMNLLIEIESDGNMVKVANEILLEHRQEFYIDEQEMERDHEIISNDSYDLDDDDSWFSNEMDFDDDFNDRFDFDGPSDDDDGLEPAGHINGRQVFLG